MIIVTCTIIIKKWNDNQPTSSTDLADARLIATSTSTYLANARFTTSYCLAYARLSSTSTTIFITLRYIQPPLTSLTLGSSERSEVTTATTTISHNNNSSSTTSGGTTPSKSYNSSVSAVRYYYYYQWWSTERSEDGTTTAGMFSSDSEISKWMFNKWRRWCGGWCRRQLIIIVIVSSTTTHRRASARGGSGGWMIIIINDNGEWAVGEGAVSCGGGEFERAARTIIMMMEMTLLIRTSLCIQFFFWKIGNLEFTLSLIRGF